jgi:hypothetical protein
MQDISELIVKVEVNGVPLLLRTENGRREGDLPLPGTALYLKANTPVREIVEAAGIRGGHDYAFPQDFFDEYMRQKGERPLGVWWYGDPAFRLMGRFLPLSELLEKLGEVLREQRGKIRVGE